MNRLIARQPLPSLSVSLFQPRRYCSQNPSSSKVRQTFLDFFEREHNHLVVPSASVIAPKIGNVDSNPLPFVNAGKRFSIQGAVLKLLFERHGSLEKDFYRQSSRARAFPKWSRELSEVHSSRRQGLRLGQRRQGWPPSYVFRDAGKLVFQRILRSSKIL